MTNINFKKLGVMLDCSRNAVINSVGFKKIVDILSDLGFNTIKIYIEDTYEVKNEKYFGYLRGKFSKTELKLMDEYAKSKGLELVPCIQTLAHLEQIYRYSDYAKIKDISDILLVGDDRTYQLIDNMFSSLAESFSTRNVNIGMDEAYLLGRGKYFDIHGVKPRYDIIFEHLCRVLQIADKYGFNCEMWGDMYMRFAYGDYYDGGILNYTKDISNEVKKKIPKNLTLINWDYFHKEVCEYEEGFDKFHKLTDKVNFAGVAMTHNGFLPNNAVSIANSKVAIKACINKGVKEVFFTMWGDNGGECSPFAVLPTLTAIAEFAKCNFDEESIKEIFRTKFKIDFDDFCLLDLPDKIFSNELYTNKNTSKPMLYSDLFLGVFDSCVKEGVSEDYYKDLSQKLKKIEDDQNFGYIFSSARSLCDVLEIKFDLGVKTRKLYKMGDKQALLTLANDRYTALLDRLEEFYNNFEIFWNKEKKSYGFDVQDIRLGGLIRRVLHCKNRLIAYCNGNVDCIPELEETILAPFGSADTKIISNNNYRNIATANII